MNPFITEHFQLKTDLARRLYHEFAEDAPIIDFHCHLSAADLAEDRAYANLAELWVKADPYKHRAMRIAGVSENSITGAASDREKYDRWADTVPQTLGNPLYHWTALELQRYFGISEPLAPGSAGRIWEAVNARLHTPEFSARALLASRRVEVVCTSDRLLDDLSAHAALAKSGFATRVLPSLRADDVAGVEGQGFGEWVAKLGRATKLSINSYADFCQALCNRLDAFDKLDCRLSDHGLDDFAYVRTNGTETAALFGRRLEGDPLSALELVRLRSGILRYLGLEYGRRGWIMQLHLGAQRRTSSRLRRIVGPAGGYAAIGNATDIPSLVAFLDDLESDGALPRTILYPLNPVDFPALATLGGSFVGEGIAGEVQLGPAWWFNDHVTGMRAQLEAIANHGLLSTFIGMTTDSRSLLSMVRHEYFRRVLCDWLGDQVAAGSLPHDEAQLGRLVRKIVCDNPRQALSL
jgi:glucuronate isomerase